MIFNMQLGFLPLKKNNSCLFILNFALKNHVITHTKLFKSIGDYLLDKLAKSW